MTSIREVAKLADVSMSTVSRALNGSGYVADGTKEKIQKAVDELGYVPNKWVRNLYRQKTGIIGVMAPESIHPFFSSLWNFMESELHENGYNMILCNTGGQKEIEREYLDTLERNLFDGMIVGTAKLPNENYMKIKKPILSLDRIIPGVPLVTSDHRQGGRIAAEKLLERGCKNVLLLSKLDDDTVGSAQSGVAFAQTMQKNGAKVVVENFEWEDVINYTQNIHRAREILTAHPDLDGMMVNDLCAAAFLKTAKEFGISVPGQLKIIAYDGTYITDFNYRTISAIEQDTFLLAKTSIRALLQLINHQSLPSNRIRVPVHYKTGDTL